MNNAVKIAFIYCSSGPVLFILVGTVFLDKLEVIQKTLVSYIHCIEYYLQKKKQNKNNQKTKKQQKKKNKK